MAHSGKYKKLESFLHNSGKDELQLSFEDVETILGFHLPKSAYQYPAFWSNTYSLSAPLAWMFAGYHSEQVDLIKQTVVFRKTNSNNERLELIARHKKVETPSDITAQQATKLISDYFNETIKDEHGRYLSWQHCYDAFSQYRKVSTEQTIDYLSLHLAFYLASWGMYRGSSFLLQKDYKVHIPVVKIILEPKYDVLLGISAYDLQKDENLYLIMELAAQIRKCYEQEKPSVPGITNNATDTLVTKIMLGTLGCVPAYDRYYVQAVKKHGVSSGIFNAKSVQDVAAFYCNNFDAFEKLRMELSKCGTEYPAMKLMDMCFWQDAYIADTVTDRENKEN